MFQWMVTRMAWGNMDIIAGEEVWKFFSQYLVIADRGDINFDGSINIMDMLLISNNILNNESYNYFWVMTSLVVYLERFRVIFGRYFHACN